MRESFPAPEQKIILEPVVHSLLLKTSISFVRIVLWNVDIILCEAKSVFENAER